MSSYDRFSVTDTRLGLLKLEGIKISNIDAVGIKIEHRSHSYQLKIVRLGGVIEIKNVCTDRARLGESVESADSFREQTGETYHVGI